MKCQYLKLIILKIITKRLSLTIVLQISSTNQERDHTEPSVQSCKMGWYHHIHEGRREKFFKLSLEFEDLFDGTFWEFYTSLVHLDLNGGAIPKHQKPFSVAKIHKVILNNELEIRYKNWCTPRVS